MSSIENLRGRPNFSPEYSKGLVAAAQKFRGAPTRSVILQRFDNENGKLVGVRRVRRSDSLWIPTSANTERLSEELLLLEGTIIPEQQETVKELFGIRTDGAITYAGYHRTIEIPTLWLAESLRPTGVPVTGLPWKQPKIDSIGADYKMPCFVAGCTNPSIMLVRGNFVLGSQSLASTRPELLQLQTRFAGHFREGSTRVGFTFVSNRSIDFAQVVACREHQGWIKVLKAMVENFGVENFGNEQTAIVNGEMALLAAAGV